MLQHHAWIRMNTVQIGLKKDAVLVSTTSTWKITVKRATTNVDQNLNK